MAVRVLAVAALIAAIPLAAGAQAPRGIESAELSRLDAWTVSAISRADGALPSSLWSQSDPAFITALFDRLPATYESPAVQALARRVLLSGGDAPRGEAAEAARKRFQALARMGAADELAIMAAGAASGLVDPAIAQFAAEAELARGSRVLACQRGRTAESDRPAPFLLQLRAFCAASGGDRASADLALELARGAGASDAWFAAALAGVGGAPLARPPAARYDSSLTAAISVAANLRPARAAAIAEAPTLALVTVARSENAPLAARAQAAALAFQRGVIPAAEARAVLRAGAAEAGAPAIAQVLRQVEAAPGSLPAASAIAGALQRAAHPAEFTAVARLFKDDIAALEAAPDSAAALAFTRAALAAGDLALAQRLAVSARAAGLDRAALAPIEAALAVAQRAQGESALRAVRARMEGAGASLARAAARDVSIFTALGAPYDGAIQTFLLANPPQGGARADASTLVSLHAAAERRALGEAGLLAATAAGSGPARLDADSLAQLLRALRAIGLEDDARAMAVEALLFGQAG